MSNNSNDMLYFLNKLISLIDLMIHIVFSSCFILYLPLVVAAVPPRESSSADDMSKMLYLRLPGIVTLGRKCPPSVTTSPLILRLDPALAFLIEVGASIGKFGNSKFKTSF